MTREEALGKIADSTAVWDLIVVGGGATGLGTAVDAASRGYRTLLLEQSDFAKATSSRSTKLIHGGFRYLRQGHFSLVRESLQERALLLGNAPHVAHPRSFIVPTYSWWQGPYYAMGLKLYDLLAGRFGLAPSKLISRSETLARMHTLEPENLRGGILYLDGQFDDARLAMTLVATLHDLGGLAINYLQVRSLTKKNGRVCGVVAHDLEGGREFELRAQAVVNATGVFVDNIRRMDDAASRPTTTVSQGAHVVLDRALLPGDDALMIPNTDDGRVLFAIPWQGRVLLGTTDIPVAKAVLEPRPLAEEVEFLLRHAARYLTKDPSRTDILSAFAGLRPLAANPSTQGTAQISRAHRLTISRSGLVTIAGGKWTTYRKMGEAAVTAAAEIGALETRPSCTRDLRLHGWTEHPWGNSHWHTYGSDLSRLRMLIREHPRWEETLDARLPYQAGEVIWAVRNEMARTVEDVLARRTRALILDARASIRVAPRVAAMMAVELGRDEQWIAKQTWAFAQLAKGYLPGSDDKSG